jgi:uncharacterized RDD family membrane protein YckC
MTEESCCECGTQVEQEEMFHYENSWVCANCKPVFLQKIKEGVSTAGKLEYAGFWIRAGAKILDGIILTVINAILQFIIFSLAGKNQGALLAAVVLTNLLNMAINIGYVTFFLGKFGATPGKMACKLKVVTPEGGDITYMRAFGRFWGEMLSGIILGIGFLMVAFDEEKRALHDRICNTRVIITK